jgi:tRNA A58 N-methylase Trm61
MAIISEQINGKVITVDIRSSNLKSASFNTEDETLQVTFNNGGIYEYYKFPWENFTKFRMSESQGKFLNTHVNGKYKYQKIK